MIKYLKIAYSISVLNVFELWGINSSIQYLLLNAYRVDVAKKKLWFLDYFFFYKCVRCGDCDID